MYSHVMVGTNDPDRAKNFYDAVFATLGVGPARADDRGRLAVTRPIDGNAAAPANGATIGFAAADPAQADAWHAAGVAAGGVAIEDPPGWREGPTGRLYLAYLRDPDGNKICALHRG